MNYKHNKRLTPAAKALRKNMTKKERRLWYDFLRDYPVRFLRQKVIDNFIVDFYCREAGLVIELDGSQHYEENGMSRDEIRTEHLERRNLRVIRVPNNEINGNFEAVCEYIDRQVSKVVNADRKG